MTTAPERRPCRVGEEATFLEVTTLRAAPTEDGRREVVGLAVPYGEDLDRPDLFTGARRRRFAPGAALVRDNAALFYGHDHLSDGLPIGRITTHSHDDDGLKITAKISETAKGEEVYTLLRDGVLDRFSIGFYDAESHLEDDGDTLVYDAVDVFEVSIVPDPAYSSARIDSVLSNRHQSHPQKDDTMTEQLTAAPEGLATVEDVTTLSASIDNLERRIATLGSHAAGDDAPHVPGNSYGEFLQMAARGEREALEFLAYVGGTTADLGAVMKDSWVGDRFRQVEAQRTTLNLFARSPLPASGMGVEYGVEGTDTTAVAEQVAEGDTLAYGKITFDTARAPLKTYGGWGDMSRQEIERSPINVVERFFDALLNKYAQTTEAAVSALVMASGVSLTGGITDMSTASGWRKFVIRAARALKATGYPIEGLAVGFDVFEELADMPAGMGTDKPFLDQDTGSISIPGLTGRVFNLPVTPIETGATTDVVRAFNSNAIRTYEAAGAPFRLQDDDITNLTKAFSIYGYMATAAEIPAAIVKPQTV